MTSPGRRGVREQPIRLRWVVGRGPVGCCESMIVSATGTPRRSSTSEFVPIAVQVVLDVHGTA